MNDINIENVAALVTKPVIKQKVEEEKPLPPIAALIENEDPGWLIRSASELQSSFAVVMVLILAFGVFSTIANGAPLWDTNLFLFNVLAGIFTLAFLGFCFFAWQVVRGEQMIHDSEPHVLSTWSLKTPKAAGLPRDLSARLQEILEQANQPSASPTQLTVIGRERQPNTWISDLESTFGRSRVAEYEEMLFKYTARQNKA